ncbi:core-binding factor subunit beta isoform X4 [Myxocyprinus asiaticus]|uniref:core-binding factor subunit beta isoform X4 n=1 Tax=Myxocyprinus asiaticus TaxID=70543 RepID=UPI0022233628|nr:core-binding factor subunit beta isoform X4 [Myxocyprinus asiaticus]
MPRVVPDQRSKFENEEFFRKLSRECEIKYTGFRDRPHEERQARFQNACRDGRSEIAFVATGTNLSLQFFPANLHGDQRQAPTREYVDFERETGKHEDALAQAAFEEARRRTRDFEDRDRSHREDLEVRAAENEDADGTSQPFNNSGGPCGIKNLGLMAFSDQGDSRTPALAPTWPTLTITRCASGIYQSGQG